MALIPLSTLPMFQLADNYVREMVNFTPQTRRCSCFSIQTWIWALVDENSRYMCQPKCQCLCRRCNYWRSVEEPRAIMLQYWEEKRLLEPVVADEDWTSEAGLRSSDSGIWV